MTGSTFLRSFVIGQASVLLMTGLATLWWSDDFMGWLLYMVGEEWALGAGNVIHTEEGGKLLTNPSAMFPWGLMVWIFGAVQILAAFTLVWLWMAIPSFFQDATPVNGTPAFLPRMETDGRTQLTVGL